MRSAGVLPLYYISTDYGATALATVESEVSNAVTWYGTPSILLDEVPTSFSDLSYYEGLYSYIHNLGGIVVLSGSQASFQRTTFPSWMASVAQAAGEQNAAG